MKIRSKTHLIPRLKKIEPDFGSSLRYSRFTERNPDAKAYWHYHPEVELVYIKRGFGNRFVGNHISKFDDGDFETVHHTELLHDLIASGKIVPNKEIKEDLTFHDPCYLGRHHGEYNAPREILKSIPGIQIKEMEKNKDKALCCGMGGGNMWYELPEGEDLAPKRLAHVGEKNVPKLATACSYCMINFNSSKAQVKETENLEIEDVASILAKSTL